MPLTPLYSGLTEKPGGGGNIADHSFPGRSFPKRNSFRLLLFPSSLSSHASSFTPHKFTQSVVCEGSPTNSRCSPVTFLLRIAGDHLPVTGHLFHLSASSISATGIAPSRMIFHPPPCKSTIVDPIVPPVSPASKISGKRPPNCFINCSAFAHD
jgi:hypothetical protein